MPDDYVYGKRTNLYEANPLRVELPLWDRKASFRGPLRDIAQETLQQRAIAQ